MLDILEIFEIDEVEIVLYREVVYNTNRRLLRKNRNRTRHYEFVPRKKKKKERWQYDMMEQGKQ